MHCGLHFNEVQWQSLESIQITREKDGNHKVKASMFSQKFHL